MIERLKIEIKGEEGLFSARSFLDVTVLITGVGMVNTAFWMGKISDKKFDYILNAGICGAFDRSIKIGEVLNIMNDTISELGAQDDAAFIKYEALNLGGTNSFYNPSTTVGLISGLRKVSAITVNTVHGNAAAIEHTLKLYSPEVESMEGAAFFRGCEGISASWFQIRAVSNYVEKRDKSKWDLPTAIKNLNDFLIKFIEEQA